VTQLTLLCVCALKGFSGIFVSMVTILPYDYILGLPTC